MFEKSVNGRRRCSMLLAVFGAAVLFSGSRGASAQPFGAWLVLPGSTNGYVNIPNTPDLNPSSAITIEAWVAVSNPHPISAILGKDFQTSYWVGLVGTTLRSYVGGHPAFDGGTLDSGWHHIAVVYDGVNHSHWIDGELVAVQAESGPVGSNSSPFQIGSDVSWAATPSGAIDEVRLWSVARTQDQLREWINKPILSAQPGLIGVWNFDGGFGDSIGGHGGTQGGSGTGILTFPAILNCGAGSAQAPCLNTHFSVSVIFRDPNTGVIGNATAVDCPNDDSAVFWFFAPNTWELLFKIVDACAPPFHHYWAFSAATTNVFYRVNVLDVRAGVAKVYFNYPGPPAPAVTDTEAFATCP
jgi:hypothetical protein